MELFQPFAIEGGTVTRIPASFDKAGVLELCHLGRFDNNDAPVYLFRGEVEPDEAARRTLNSELVGSDAIEAVDFDLATTPGQVTKIHLESFVGQLTLYCPDTITGFIRFVTGCGCVK